MQLTAPADKQVRPGEAGRQEAAEETARHRAWLLSSRRLQLTLFATDLCNFRCTYCYEDHLGQHMPPDVQDAVCRLIDRRADDLEELVVSWFGGEPLMVPHVIEKVGGHARRLAEEKSFRLRSSATTNAWNLTVAMAERLLRVASVSSYQVTLDGPPEHHDRTRLRRSGLGSFDRVWGNLQALRASDLPVGVLVRCHVTGDNARAWEGFAPQVRQLCEDPRFRVHVHPIRAMGSPGDGEFNFASDEAVADVRAWLAEPRGAAGEEICYAATPSAVIVRADGALNRCTVAVRDPRNHVGRLSPDGRMLLDHEALAPWFAGWAGDADMLACPKRHSLGMNPVDALGEPAKDAGSPVRVLATRRS